MKDKDNSKIDIEKAKIKSLGLVKKAKEAAVKEQLKNDSDLKHLNLKFRDLSIGKAGIFFFQNLSKGEKILFKERFSVACVLLTAFVSIIATYWPMRCLYNTKPVIPLIETNRANVLKCKPFEDKSQKGIFKCSYESEKLKETTKKETQSVEIDVLSATENTESWLKRKWPRLYSLIFFWKKDVPNKEISIKPTNTENPADTSAELDKKTENIKENEKPVENLEQISQGKNNNEQESQVEEQKTTDSENSVKSEQNPIVSPNTSVIDSQKQENSAVNNNKQLKKSASNNGRSGRRNNTQRRNTQNRNYN